jgi:type I restriction enzyme, S subunit
MEGTVVSLARLQQKNKWVYSAHSKTAQQIEQAIANSRFDVSRFGDLTLEIADGLHGVRHYVDDGVVMLAVGNVTEYELDLTDKKMVTDVEHQRLRRSQAQRGDLLITITGRLGTALLYNSNEPANLSAHVARARVNADLANSEYIATYFNSSLGKQQVEEYSIGSLYPHINVNRLEDVRVILPPRPIQDRIAQVMQEAYTARRRMLSESEDLLQHIESYV